MCHGFNCVPERYAAINLQDLRMWPYLERGSFQKSNQVKIGLWTRPWLQYDWCPYFKGKFGYRERHTQRNREQAWRTEDLELCSQIQWYILGLPEAEEAKENPYATGFRGQALLTPQLQLVNVQNCEDNNFCCSNSPICGALLKADPRK